MRHGAALSHPRRAAFVELRRNPLGNFAQFSRRRLRLVLRRHFAGVDTKQHFAPTLRDQHVGKVARQRVELELAFVLLRIVTSRAVPRKESFNALAGVHVVAEHGDREENQAGSDRDSFYHFEAPFSFAPATLIRTL